MKNLFSYDSKLVSVLSFIGDLLLVNISFLLCCFPIFTIGAAQAGLHNAMRILLDPLDGRSPVKGFFRGFISGFGRITLAWLLFLVIDGVLGYTLYMSFTYADTGLFVPWGIPLAAIGVAVVYQCVMSLFHSQFGCTFGQLLRNSAMMLLWHPLASVLTGVLMCIPPVIFLMNPNLFVEITPLFLTLYFSIAACLCHLLTRKAFKMLIDNFNNPDGEEPQKEIEN